ncbi:hypothetical protein HanHA300_Chr11g0384451 [Helianthus annuus]|nr:hypothetical protein HanHA300_Chr11g0384451 [Helianthus annuus]
MFTALSFLFDEIWPPYIAKSSGVVERSMAVQRISDNVVSVGSINKSGIESKNSSF